MAKCKYPNEVCGNMIVYHGVAYCDSIPCSLKDELPKRTNADRIREMTNEELAETIYELDFDNGLCPLYDMYEKRKNDSGGCSYNCKKCLLEWLESECDEEC